MRRVAIVGGGAAGMAAAYRLAESGCEVSLVEACPRPGGNGFEVDIDVPGRETWRVESGVSELNRWSSPRFTEMLDEFGVERTPIATDASLMTPRGRTVWTSRRAPARSRHRQLEKKRFEREAPEVLESHFYDRWTARRYLDRRGYSDEFRRFYLYPRTAGCLAMPEGDPGRLPIRAFVSFWKMNALLDADAVQRVCVTGGMRRCGQAFARRFARARGRLLCSHRVVGVERGSRRVRLRLDAEGRGRRILDVDDVVFALAPDRAVALLDEATASERLIASAFESRRVRRVIHQDPRLMPRRRTDWSAYNYHLDQSGESGLNPSLTCYLNRFARLDPHVPDVFVTLDPHLEIDPERILDDRWLTHPQAGPAAAETARRVEKIQGRRRTWFCGSYLYEPFLHEQAVASALEVAERIVAESRPFWTGERRETPAWTLSG